MAQPTVIQKLIQAFQELPGIGPRQAERFAYALIDRDPEVLDKFAAAVRDAARTIERCASCGRVVAAGSSVCALCTRDEHIRMITVVEKDQDLDALERTQLRETSFHILGGLVVIGKQKERVRDRISLLYKRVKKIISIAKSIEIVLAFAATPEGDATADYIERVFDKEIAAKKVTVTRLGRGLSTGTELEYSDPETLKRAFESRK